MEGGEPMREGSKDEMNKGAAAVGKSGVGAWEKWNPNRFVKAARLGELSKTKIQIPEDRYRSDLELHDRYLGFSSELLRMALASIAAIGAIIGLLSHDGDISRHVTAPTFVYPATGALITLVSAAGCALLHRYLASDGMYHHFRAIKLLILSEALDHSSLEYEARRCSAEKSEKRRNLRFWLAGWLMLCSGLLLIAGIAFVGVAIRGLLAVA